MEAAHERFEERLDCVIVLRVLTKEEIQKLADRTREIRGKYRHPSHLHTPQSIENQQYSTEGTQPDDWHQNRSRSRLPSLSRPLPSPLQRNDSDTAAFTAQEERTAQGRREGLGKRRAWTYHLGQGLRDILVHSLTQLEDKRHEEDKHERKSSRRPDRNRERRDRGEYEYSDSEDEFKEKQPKMLEAPSTVGSTSNADFIRDSRDRRHERDREAEPAYMSGGNGRKDESQSRY